MATWSEWFKAAKFHDIPLDQFLLIDPVSDLKRLKESGLPCFDSVILTDSSEWDLFVSVFLEKYGLIWIRVVNKQDPKERYYKIGIETMREFHEFVDSLHIDVALYSLQLFQNCKVRFGGNIVSNEHGVKIEMALGSQDIVGKSKGDFFHGNIDWAGFLSFKENVSEDLLRAAQTTLSFIRLNRNTFLQGYFEFVVSPENDVFFMDYKTNLK